MTQKDLRNQFHEETGLHYYRTDIEGFVWNDAYIEWLETKLTQSQSDFIGYNAEKMAESKWNEIVVNLKLDTLHKGMWCGGFQHGFNAHKELVKDKLFTVHDMLKISQAAFVIKSNNETIIEDFENWFNKRIKLLQPTEWEVEFINGKLTLKQ